MMRFRPVSTAGLLLTLMSFAPLAASATERANFFDANKKPTVKFDEKMMTWTLSNGAIQRVLQYDAKQGSLRTVALHDIKRLRDLGVGSTSEGAFSFVADLKESVLPLTGWKMTETQPTDDWTGLDYAAADWKPASLPMSSTKTVWLRVAIPADRMKFDRSYSLVFDHAIDGAAEIYVDGTLAEKVAAGSRPASRFVQVDLLPKNRVIAIKFTGARLGNLTGSVGIAEVGTAPAPVDLQSNWQYMIHTINTGADGSQVLTITLSGTKQYQGFDVDVNYQICSGDEPTMAKWFTFVNHRATRFLIDEVVYDDWKLPGAKPTVQTFPGGVFTATDSVSHDGLMTAVLSPLGSSESSPDGKAVATILRPYFRIKPDGRQVTPKSLTAFYAGPNTTGAFAYQLYVGQYESKGTAASVPTVFSTKSYGEKINAATCDRIIPEVAKFGAKVFLLDDGWQTNIPANSGTYGDWITNRLKFPLGLAPVAAALRERNIRLGLFAAPAEVSELSQATLDQPEWLLRRSDGSRVAFSDNTVGVCFTSGPQENFTKSMQIFCRMLDVSYLKLGGNLFYDDCMEMAHDHPVAHALYEQINHWRSFGDTMLTVNRNFILNREVDAHPSLTNVQDTGTFGLWNAAANSEDIAAWYAQADSVRRGLYDVSAVRPSFTLSAEAPCHIPTDDINALGYLLSSAAANVSNLQLLGQIEPMTAKEADTVQKWIKWNEDNRPWLAYTQPIAALGRPFDPSNPNDKPHLDGVMHLRSELQGRYGYVCLWNPTGQAANARIAFNLADYFIQSPVSMDIVRVKNGQTARLLTRDGAVSLPEIAMPPHSWEIYELRGLPAGPATALTVPAGVSKRQ